MYTTSELTASSGEMYFSLNAWRRVRDSSHDCFGRKNEAAVGDLLLPVGKHQSLDREDSVRIGSHTPEVADSVMCSIVFASRGIVPFNPKPFALLVGYSANISDSTCLLLQTKTLAYIWSHF